MYSVRSEREFQNVLRRLQLALESSQIGVWEHDTRTSEIRWDLQMHALYQTGETRQLVSAATWMDAIHPDDLGNALADFDRAIATKGAYYSDFRIILPTGAIRHIRSRAHYFEEDGRATLIGAEWDITADIQLNRELSRQMAIAEERAVALEQSRKQIEYAANHDYLTGLPNRRCFDERFAGLRDDAAVSRLAIFHVDLDNFKTINDTFGHAAGDTVLKATAQRISSTVPPGSFAARIGGDEFIVLIPDFASVDGVRQVAETLVKLHRKGVKHEDKVIRTGVSIGVAWTSEGDMATLLADSDIALYSAKKRGRARVEFFSAEMKSELVRERLLTDQLKRALDENELVPFYQLQVDAQSRKVVAMEALVRWRHPDHGLLLPEAFMDILGDGELSARLDAGMLQAVLADRRAWQAEGLSVPRVAVNISAARLSDPRLIDQLDTLQIEPDAISFELLETIFLDEIEDDILASIHHLKEKSIEIEVDDFGSGHASMIGLVKLKPKRLKIDRRLVLPITRSREQLSLIGSIVDIARALDIEVIAEGVETLDHADLLAAVGCKTLQGFAIAFPMSSEETLAYLKRLS